MDEGTERGVTESSGIHALAEKQPLLVANHPTVCKVSKAENKVGKYEDEERMKLG